MQLFRLIWAEPRQTAPVRVWRDWVLLAVLVAGGVLEGLLRSDLPMRVPATIVTVVLTLLWRRTSPLLAVAMTRLIATATWEVSASGSSRSTRPLGHLGLERHSGRTPHGEFTRVAQRLLAMAAVIWHNWATGVTSKRSLIAFDH